MAPDFWQTAAPYASALAVMLGSFLTANTAKKARDAQAKNEAYTRAATTSESAMREWRGLYSEQRDLVKDLQVKVAVLTRRMNESEGREYRLKRELNAVYDWIEAGAKPPPPSRPDYLEDWKNNGY